MKPLLVGMLLLTFALPVAAQSEDKAVKYLEDLGAFINRKSRVKPGAVDSVFFPNAGATDVAMAFVGSFAYLEALNISGSPVTDAGIRSLAGNKRLNLFTLQNTRVTDAGVAEMESAMPGLKVER